MMITMMNHIATEAVRTNGTGTSVPTNRTTAAIRNSDSALRRESTTSRTSRRTGPAPRGRALSADPRRRTGTPAGARRGGLPAQRAVAVPDRGSGPVRRHARAGAVRADRLGGDVVHHGDHHGGGLGVARAAGAPHRANPLSRVRRPDGRAGLLQHY